MEKKKVGIMGGTFNPIHNWHLAMAQQALEEFDLDRYLYGLLVGREAEK